jgi:hypothetical protein
MEFFLRIFIIVTLVTSNLLASERMLSRSRDALLSYSFIKKRVNKVAKLWERKILGDYAEELFLIAPLITGQVEFSALDVKFYLNTKNESGGVQYVYKF